MCVSTSALSAAGDLQKFVATLKDLHQIASHHPGFLMYFFFIPCTMPTSENTVIPVLLCTRFLFLCIYLQMGVFKHVFKFHCFYVSLSENGRGRWGAANEEIASES